MEEIVTVKTGEMQENYVWLKTETNMEIMSLLKPRKFKKNISTFYYYH
jgi:hypothetical protein